MEAFDADVVDGAEVLKKSYPRQAVGKELPELGERGQSWS